MTNPKQFTPNLAQEVKGRSAELTANRFVRDYSHKVVIQTTQLENQLSICQFAGVPKRFQPHPFDPVARCIHVHPEQDPKNPFVWWLTCEYSTDYVLEDWDDPIYKLPEVEWEFEQKQVIVPGTLFEGKSPAGTKVKYKKGLCNAARQPFDPPPVYDRCDPVLCVERIEATFDEGIAQLYVNAINSDTFLGGDPGTIKCTIRAKRFQWRDTFRWTVNYRFAYRAEGWQPQSLNIGTYERNEEDQPVPFTDTDGNVIQKRLDKDGHALDADADDVFITSDAYRSIPFALLKIQESINKMPTLNQK